MGRGRDAPLAAASLQRTVLLAHLFGSCCRARCEAARLRVAAFELARHRATAEPALLAALCFAWPEALHLDAPPVELPGGGAAVGLGQMLGALACRNVGRPLDGGGPAAGAAAVPSVVAAAAAAALQSYRHAHAHGQANAHSNVHAHALLAARGGAGWAALHGAATHGLMADGLVRQLACARAAGGGRGAKAARGVAGAAASAGLSASDFECCAALELFASAQGWLWTVNHLTANHLMPLLRQPPAEAGGVGGVGGGNAARTVAIYLLGRVGLMAPSARAAPAVWLRQQLGLVLQEEAAAADGPGAPPREQAVAAQALLEMHVAAPDEVPASELPELGRWLRQHGPKRVPVHLRAACKAIVKQA